MGISVQTVGFAVNEKQGDSPLDVANVGQGSWSMLQTLESISDAVFTVDNNWRVTFWNRAAEELYGRERQKVLGKNLWEAFPEGVGSEFYPQLISAMEEKKHLLFTVQGIIDSSKWFSVKIYPFVSGLTVLSQDISKQRLAEEQLARLERLNMVGQMAASIGHEIRNPMTVVRGFLQLMSQKEKYQDDLKHFLLMIEELDQANSIITNFLFMANNKAINLISTDLNEIIINLLPSIQADSIQKGISVSTITEELPSVLLDITETRQLVLSLTRNACESMQSGGLLTIETSVGNNGDVVLEIHDQGQGIPPEILEHIGTPFQSTKENASGLGLAVCYSIVNRMKAKIEIDTGNEGTTVRVTFKTARQSNEAFKDCSS